MMSETYMRSREEFDKNDGNDMSFLFRRAQYLHKVDLSLSESKRRKFLKKNQGRYLDITSEGDELYGGDDEEEDVDDVSTTRKAEEAQEDVIKIPPTYSKKITPEKGIVQLQLIQ